MISRLQGLTAVLCGVKAMRGGKTHAEPVAWSPVSTRLRDAQGSHPGQEDAATSIVCLWPRLGRALSPWHLQKSFLRAARPSSIMVLLAPITTEALVGASDKLQRSSWV